MICAPMHPIIIYALMTWLVPLTAHKHHSESLDDASDRYATIAMAIANEARDDETLALYLITIARHESAFTRTVHDGTTRGDGGRSWGLFQIMIGLEPSKLLPLSRNPDRYRAFHIVGTGSQATRRAVRSAAHILRPMIAVCGARPRCVFIRYGGVRAPLRGRARPLVLARVATFARLRSQRQK